MKNFLLEPKEKENWLVNLESKTDGKYTDFYRGILLANEQDTDKYLEVSEEWKNENGIDE